MTIRGIEGVLFELTAKKRVIDLEIEGEKMSVTLQSNNLDLNIFRIDGCKIFYENDIEIDVEKKSIKTDKNFKGTLRVLIKDKNDRTVADFFNKSSSYSSQSNGCYGTQSMTNSPDGKQNME
ncbi:MAG: hypothetical protein Fur0024_5510 [Patescibacteria group bacterium]